MAAKGLEPWMSKGVMIGALVVVGGVGVLVGRWSKSVPQVEAKPVAQASASTAAAPTSSSSLLTPPPPVKFDLTEVAGFNGGIPIRPMDRDIFDMLTGDKLTDRKQLVDLFPDRPYHVRVMGSVAEHRYGQVLVDLNRDGVWDERWDLKSDGVSRNVPKDPAAGDEPVKYTLSHGRWQIH